MRRVFRSAVGNFTACRAASDVNGERGFENLLSLVPIDHCVKIKRSLAFFKNYILSDNRLIKAAFNPDNALERRSLNDLNTVGLVKSPEFLLIVNFKIPCALVNRLIVRDCQNIALVCENLTVALFVINALKKSVVVNDNLEVFILKQILIYDYAVKFSGFVCEFINCVAESRDIFCIKLCDK